ncbi:hypothetical protein ACFL0T_01755 [Candidatus Omnitrophota bacterium]
MMRRYINSIIVILLIAFTLSIVESAQAKSKISATTSQYKNSYKYYMEKGQDDLDEGYYEAALESFKRALSVVPSSSQARAKIRSIRRELEIQSDPLLARARKSAIERALEKLNSQPAEDFKRQTHFKLAKKEDISDAEEMKEPESDEKEISEPEEEYKAPVKKKSRRRVVASKHDDEEPELVKDEISRRTPEPKKRKKKAVEEATTLVTRESYVRPKIKIGEEEIKPAKSESQSKKKDDEAKLVQDYPTKHRKKSKFRMPSFTHDHREYADLHKFNDGINEKIQEGGDSLNEGIEPTHVSGEYRVGFGATEDDFIWKDANADHYGVPGDANFRYLFGRDRHNTYDKEVYSRLKVDIDRPITDNLKTYNQIVIDPWTFVGTKRVFIAGRNGDNVELDLKYWSNTRRTLNETYRTERGDIVNVGENKIIDGETSHARYQGLVDWGSNQFTLPEGIEIDRQYVPWRKSWVEYNDEPYKAKVFFMSNQDEAITSNDPMKLSNNKLWWEESPWLDTYEPSRVFERNGTSGPADYGYNTREPVKRGQWIRNQSFIARDSDQERLTFLRGASFGAEFDNGTSVEATAAVPRNLWDTYDQATSIPAALRVDAVPITDNLKLGGLYTLKTGFRHNSVEAYNNVVSLDGAYKLFENTDILGQAAVSNMHTKEAIGYDNKFTGYASKVGVNNRGPLSNVTGGSGDKYELGASITHMDDKFVPGLSSYRFTRKDLEFTKHIYFDDINPENTNNIAGDGVDVGRNAINVNAKAEFPDSKVDTRFDFRNVHTDGGSYVESAYRGEVAYKPTSKLSLKGLIYYLDLPDTIENVDPLINAKSSYSAFSDYFAYEDRWLQNTSIVGGEDPSIGTISAGLKYDFFDYLTGEGIFEATNDPKDFPRGLLNNAFVTDTFRDGIIWDSITPLLWNQGAFGLPPYGYYGIYKTKFIYEPFDPLKITLNYVYNENKYAMPVDDNSTHHGVEFEYKPSNRLKLGFLYQYSRQIDLYKEFVTNEGQNYDGHHNIFGSLDYELNNNQHLSLMFGEYVGYPSSYPEEYGAIGPLDTRHIIRVAYSGDWGNPQHKKLDPVGSFRPLGEFKPGIPGATFVSNIYGGFAKYTSKADVAAVDSEWDNYLAKIDFGMDFYDKEEWEGGLKVGLLGALEDVERWRIEQTRDFQRNRMDYRGADVDANIGWALNPSPYKYITFTPLINAGYRRIEFDRHRFTTYAPGVNALGTVGERFNVSFLGLGGKVNYDANEQFDIYGGGYWAPLVYTATDGDAVGRVSSNRGNIYHAEGGCDYALTDRFDLSLGGYWDLQHIDRAQRINNGIVTTELPDNKLESLGVRFGGLYRF